MDLRGPAWSRPCRYTLAQRAWSRRRKSSRNRPTYSSRRCRKASSLLSLAIIRHRRSPPAAWHEADAKPPAAREQGRSIIVAEHLGAAARDEGGERPDADGLLDQVDRAV